MIPVVTYIRTVKLMNDINISENDTNLVVRIKEDMQKKIEDEICRLYGIPPRVLTRLGGV